MRKILVSKITHQKTTKIRKSCFVARQVRLGFNSNYLALSTWLKISCSLFIIGIIVCPKVSSYFCPAIEANLKIIFSTTLAEDLGNRRGMSKYLLLAVQLLAINCSNKYVNRRVQLPRQVKAKNNPEASFVESFCTFFPPAPAYLPLFHLQLNFLHILFY